MDIFNIIGAIGGVFYLLSYLLLNAGRISGNSYEYIGLNLLAATCMAISLFVHWNGPSFTAQLCWIAISAVGLINCYFDGRQKARESAGPTTIIDSVEPLPTQLNA